ncbi:hypothetical protein ACHAO4_005791 [Trichoderma viride]
MPRSLRPLLPATEGSSSTLNAASSKRKRTETRVACEACRKKKSKCNAQRPVCKGCELRGSECVYDADPAETRGQALRRRFDAQEEKRSVHEEFHQLLRLRPEAEVLEMVHRIRAGVTVEDIVRHVHSGDVLLQLSVSPERRYHYSLGRVLNIPDFLRAASSQYTTSLVYRKSFDPKWHWSSPPQLPPSVADYRALYDAPFHVAEMVDADIDAAKPSRWTSVSSDDELLRALLKSYFTHEYLFFPFFHKDSFLQDMVSGRRRFCSPLLVNAVLASSCHGYSKLQGRSEFWNPASMTYRFMAETRRLWELEADEKTITKVQAALILQGQYNKSGLDKIGWSYCLQAVATSEEMGLFTTYLRPNRPKWRVVQAMTAWIVFTLQGIQCFHFDTPPLVATRPTLALPDNAEAYGEIWVKYPTASTPVPLHFGQTFKTIIEFRTIVTDIICDIYPLSTASNEKITPSLTRAAEYQSRLRNWYEQLPSYLSSQNLILPTHFDIHMHYWFITARLFEQVSVVEEGQDTDPPPMEESAGNIVTNAVANLQTLIRLYYSCHGNDTYNMFLVAMCSYVGFGALHAISLLDESASALRQGHESTVLLCAGVLHDQGTSVHLSEIVFRLMHQSLPAAVAAELARIFHISDVNQSKMAFITRHAQSSWPLSVALKPGDTENRRLDNLLRAIKELSADESDGETTPTDNLSVDGSTTATA